MIVCSAPREATFVARANRFVVKAQTEEGEVEAFLPTTGRLGEILVPGAPLILHPKKGSKRRLFYDVWAGAHDGEWVGLDSRVAPAALRTVWAEIPGVPRVSLRPEVKIGRHRLDFALEGGGWVEVKSVTLVEDGTALFPDAPTERGRHHVDLLGEAVLQDLFCAIFFVILRTSAKNFRPHVKKDPAFAQSLAKAGKRGVLVRALSFQVTPEGLIYDGERPVLGG